MIKIVEKGILFQHLLEMILLLKLLNKCETYFQTSSKTNFTFCYERFIDGPITIDLHDAFPALPVLERNEVESID